MKQRVMNCNNKIQQLKRTQLIFVGLYSQGSFLAFVEKRAREGKETRKRERERVRVVDQCVGFQIMVPNH